MTNLKPYRPRFCTQCGAPNPREGVGGFWVCGWCGSSFLPRVALSPAAAHLDAGHAAVEHTAQVLAHPVVLWNDMGHTDIVEHQQSVEMGPVLSLFIYVICVGLLPLALWLLGA